MTPRGKRALIGCGIGCGGILLMVIASAIAFTLWLRQPAAPLEPLSLLSEDSIGYIELSLSKEDPQTKAFLRALIARTSEIPAQADVPVPEWVLARIGGYQKHRNEAAMDQILPVVAAWTLRHRPDTGRFEQNFLLNLRSIGNRMRFVDWVMGFTFGGEGGPASVQDHGDETIYRIESKSGRGLTFFIRNGSVYFTNDPRSAQELVDRLSSEAVGVRGTEALAILLEGIPQDRPLRGAVINTDDAIRRIVGRIGSPGKNPPELSWDRLESATMRGGFTEEGGFAARLEFKYEGAPPAGSGKVLEEVAIAALERWNVSVESRTTTDEERVGLDLVFPDLLDRARLVPEPLSSR